MNQTHGQAIASSVAMKAFKGTIGKELQQIRDFAEESQPKERELVEESKQIQRDLGEDSQPQAKDDREDEQKLREDQEYDR